MSWDFSKSTTNWDRIEMPDGTGAAFAKLTAALSSSVICIACKCRVDSFTTFGAYQNRLFTTFTGGPSSTTGIIMGFGATASSATQYPFVFVRIRSSEGSSAIQTSVPVDTGITYTMGAKIDIPNDTVTVYLNGEQIGSQSSFPFTTTYFRYDGTDTRYDAIGTSVISNSGSADSSGITWDGAISEFATWGGDIGDDGFLSHHQGIVAPLIRSDVLTMYFPLYYGEEQINNKWKQHLNVIHNNIFPTQEHPATYGN